MQMDKIHFTHFIVYTSAGTQHRLETNIYSTKVEILNLKLLNHGLENRVPTESPMIGHTNKQTEITTLYIF